MHVTIHNITFIFTFRKRCCIISIYTLKIKSRVYYQKTFAYTVSCNAQTKCLPIEDETNKH